MDRFIVGTGRCGSTLLSRMLRYNPQLLELSEFFCGLDWNRRLSLEPISGGEFRELISADHPIVTMALTRGYRPHEITYPFGSPGARHAPCDPIPWALAVMLPLLSPEPEALFDEVCAVVEAQSPRAAPEHARALFEWLRKRAGRSTWLERSGGSVTWLDDLIRAYPAGRFLHLHRQGEEAALSMREHAVFRLAVMLTYQLELGETAGNDDLSRLGDDADHVARLLASRPPVQHFGTFWTAQVLAGHHAAKRLDADDYHEVAFEELLRRPAEVLEEISRFLDLPDPCGTWRYEAERLVNGLPPLRVTTLSVDEETALAAACSPGNRLLGRE